MQIVIEAYRKTDSKMNHTVAIVFDGYRIVDFVRQPNDYTVEEFMDYLADSFENGFVIVDDRGCSHPYCEHMKGKFFFNSRNLDTCRSYLKSDKYLMRFMMKTDFNKKKDIDFNKMLDQLDNIEPVESDSSGNVRLRTKDKNKDTGFARCILTYIAYLENEAIK